MARSKTYYLWLQAGYELFAQEGLDGVQVEKIARKINLNKSGFYHYFGDQANFCERLIKHHDHLFETFERKVLECKNFDPEYLNVLIEEKILVFVQMQLVRSKGHTWFSDAHVKFDARVDNVVLELWKRHTKILDNSALAIQFHTFTRDMFYSRISWDNFDFYFLKKMSDEIADTAAKFLAERERMEDQNNQ